ncbi:MAG: phosphatidylglycerophosphatase A [Candidatus Omnitrophota bacterium]
MDPRGRKSLFHNIIGTVCGLGYFPFAPGTAGSFAGLLLCFLLYRNVIVFSAVFVVLFVLGVVSARRIEEETGLDDPSFVVIDEFACIFIAFLFVPMHPEPIITGFIIYRIIDIIKVEPMRSLEKLGGGWGIMLDDLVGGIYTNLILQTLLFFKIV